MVLFVVNFGCFELVIVDGIVFVFVGIFYVDVILKGMLLEMLVMVFGLCVFDFDEEVMGVDFVGWFFLLFIL